MVILFVTWVNTYFLWHYNTIVCVTFLETWRFDNHADTSGHWVCHICEPPKHGDVTTPSLLSFDPFHFSWVAAIHFRRPSFLGVLFLPFPLTWCVVR